MKPWEQYAGDAQKGPWSQYAKEAEPMSRGERIRAGMFDPIQGGAQLLTRALPDSVVQAGNTANNWLADKTGLVGRLPEGGVDQQTREREAEYQARRGPNSGIDWLRLLGNVVSPVNVGAGAMAPAAATLTGRAAVGAGLGGGMAALAPATGEGDFWEEKGTQAAAGLVAGGATPVAAAGLGRLISPRASTNPQLQALRDAGVKPTIGQTLGGMPNRIEENLMSVPILGNVIGGARQRAVTQFNRETINRVTRPIGVQIDDVGQEGVKKASEALSRQYDDVLQRLGDVNFDQTWRQQVGQLRAVERALTPDQRGAFAGTIKNLFDGRIDRLQGVTASKMKDIDRDLGEQIRRLSRSPTAAEQERGQALMAVQSMLRDQVARQSPEVAEEMAKINSGWANLVRVESAAAAAQNNGGVFTPAQLARAVKQGDNRVRKRGVAHGTALMQDWSSAGQAHLGNVVPNSGTPERAMWAALGLGSAAFNPSLLAAPAIGAAAYTPPAQALLRGLVSSRPQAAQPVAGLLNTASPMLAPGSGLLALESLK
jgi:hypothetical protein